MKRRQGNYMQRPNNTHIEGIIRYLKEVEEAAGLCRHIVITIILSHARMKFGQCILRIFPMNCICLPQGYQRNSRGQHELTEGCTSRAQEKSSMESVMPSASGLSSEADGGGTYLYSFFKTESEKYGLDLKYCHEFSVDCSPVSATTHEFDSVAPRLLRITCHP